MKKIVLIIFCLLLLSACSDGDESEVKIAQCEHKIAGGASCGAGYVSVPGGCCPSTNPWYCNGMCYMYCTDAAVECGENVIKGV